MNLMWKISNHVISELYVNGTNIIYPWGFETADSSAFFSLEAGVGWRHQCLKEFYDSSLDHFTANIVTQMKEGKWELNIADKIESLNQVTRFVEAQCHEESIFMDFVMRFRFKKEHFEFAQISGKKIYHKASNVYHQYPVNVVVLSGNQFDIKIKIMDSKVPSQMEPVMYVRDSDNEWVVHVRMLPKIYEKEVIKICTRWARTRPLPQPLSNLILKNKKLRNFLWYRGEVNPHNYNFPLKLFNPSAYPMCRLARGTKLMWKVSTEINEKSNHK
ncbi:hypothetical protein [Anaerospora sp.]|uniref:hypothetical protein n=1 Tax=Anaerospora sp. TaxID=1960278 RepID=UPI00289CF3A6|nr:hypothetical protein [Anaerospora sp.]